MAEWFGKYESAGLKMKDMQLFKNVIHKSLITGCPETTVLSTVPLPELHLLMGLVNWALELMYKVMPEKKTLQLKEKMRAKGISVQGYQGGGLDGVNSHLFLKHLLFLSAGAPANVRPIFTMIEKFRKVVHGCFSTDLSSTYLEDINSFNSDVAALIPYTKRKLHTDINPTWKVHILVCHLKDFLIEKQV